MTAHHHMVDTTSGSTTRQPPTADAPTASAVPDERHLVLASETSSPHPAGLTTAVEDVLRAAVDRLGEPGRAGARRVVDAGGKRLRPDLVLRCAALTAGGPDARPADPVHDAVTVEAAVAVELLHSATLLHDDLLDDAPTRRGVGTVHEVEGPATAILAGDALIAQSWRMVAPAGAAGGDLADALADMCSGEQRQSLLAFDADARPLDVLRVAQLKTGALLRAAARIGGRRAGLSEAQVRALGAFGSDLGVALQLTDDLLDVAASAEAVGKPCGADFVAGTVTLPAVYALAAGTAAADELRALLRPGLTVSEAARALALLRDGEGVARTAGLARSFARRASRAVASVAALPGPAVDGALVRALAAAPLEYVESQLRAPIGERADGAGVPDADDCALLVALVDDGRGDPTPAVASGSRGDGVAAG